MDPTSFSHQLFTIPPWWIWIVLSPQNKFGFVPSKSFGFPVLANSNFLLPDCFCASPICFLRFSNDSFSEASCFSASERNFINTNWKHQSSFFWKAKFAHFTKYDLLGRLDRLGWKQELLDENIENMPSSLDSLSRLEDKGQNLNYKQLQASKMGWSNKCACWKWQMSWCSNVPSLKINR